MTEEVGRAFGRGNEKLRQKSGMTIWRTEYGRMLAAPNNDSISGG